MAISVCLRALRSTHSCACAPVGQRHRGYSTIKSLQEAFRDPKSPFHIALGSRGPSHPQDHGLTQADLTPAEEAHIELLKMGYDPTSFWEQPIVWGDNDSFQHVNNVRYLRFFESGRIKWMVSLGEELGGPEKAEAMVKGKGVSLILKSISLNYKRPVTYPDTLLIAHKPHFGPLNSASHTETGPPGTKVEPVSSKDAPETREKARRIAKTHFHCLAVAWSYKQRRIVTESDAVLVWYDYDKLTKCNPGDEARRVLEGRMAIARDLYEGAQLQTSQ